MERNSKRCSQSSKESLFANTSYFISYLSNFSHSRLDLFSNIQDFQKFKE